MIIKYFELKKKNLIEIKYFLLYGNNKGLIEETINSVLKPILPKNIFNYDEIEILNNPESFKEKINNKSFFEDQKLIIIKRVSDKILKIIEEVIKNDLEDIAIILVSENLEKKSKIRNYFEKEKNTTCVPFYEDNHQTLAKVVQNFLREKNLKLSQQNINIIVERSRGDRINLNNELIKIENYLKNKKNISENEILKITNLAENYQVGELVDNSLAKNKSRTLTILNENSFNTEDCILILRIFLSKLKRLLKIKTQQQKDKNLDNIISSFRPPIFWKEKEIVKQQIKKLEYDKIKELIIKTNNIEFLIKKNPTSSIFIVSDFILENAIEN
tara:strand:+ start:1373 stop:2362 length:990 start_codon:yes stop_codon:yes gene_type:complete